MKTSRAELVLILAATAVAACGGRGGEPERTAGDGEAIPLGTAVERAARYQPVPLEVYLRDGALAAGLDRAGTRARLGAPDSVTARPTPNRHDPQVTDSIVTLHYPGARYDFYVVTQAERDLLDLAVIWSDAHLRHAMPGIGSTADSVRLLLGEPLAADAASLEYDCLTCEVPLPVKFEIEDARVRAVRFDYYVD